MTRLRGLPHLPRWCLIGWILGLTSQINIAVRLDDFAYKLLAMQLAPSYQSFQQQISAWTESDLARYYEHLSFDLIHPVIYGVAITLNLAWGFRAAGVSSRYDLWLGAPLLAGLLDEIENYAHYTAITLYSSGSEAMTDLPAWTFMVGCTAAKLKWGIASVSLTALPVLAWRARHASRLSQR